jgi:hypothetical protein
MEYYSLDKYSTHKLGDRNEKKINKKIIEERLRIS